MSKLIEGFVKSLEVTELAERIAKLEDSPAMRTRPRNLAERVMELERRCQKEPSRFYMIWGQDDADCAAKLEKAKADGEIKRADKFDIKVWTKSIPMPAPRWTSFPEMLDSEEFQAWYDAMPNRSQESEMDASSRALMLQYSTEDLYEVLLASLSCVT